MCLRKSVLKTYIPEQAPKFPTPVGRQLHKKTNSCNGTLWESPFSVALTYIALFVSINITILSYTVTTYHDLFQKKKKFQMNSFNVQKKPKITIFLPNRSFLISVKEIGLLLN